MKAVGIDVSKDKSMVTILQPLGVVAAEPFEVGNDTLVGASAVYTGGRYPLGITTLLPPVYVYTI